MGEPFYLVCGFGETGSLLCRTLDRLDIGFVVIDIDGDRIAELGVENFQFDPPALRTDARRPESLKLAGLRHPRCLGVIALTNDPQANLAVAMTVRLLNPAIPVLCRADSPVVAANMAAFGADHIIYPYERFARYLATAIKAPASSRLIDLLIGVPGMRSKSKRETPRGHWVVCGYGRFGKEVARGLERQGLSITIVDPNPQPSEAGRHVPGYGTEARVLEGAGIGESVGIVAGTDDDISNLAIAMNARQLNPGLFVIARQNLQANHLLFEAFDADLTMVPSDIVAHECLALISTPLLARFLDAVASRDDAWAKEVAANLVARTGNEISAIWSVAIDAGAAPAVIDSLSKNLGQSVLLGDLLRDPTQRDAGLKCIALLLERADKDVLLPNAETPVAAGDRVLFAGLAEARDLQRMTLHNSNVLDYVHTGREAPGGWIWQWLSGDKAPVSVDSSRPAQ